MMVVVWGNNIFVIVRLWVKVFVIKLCFLFLMVLVFCENLKGKFYSFGVG